MLRSMLPPGSNDARQAADVQRMSDDAKFILGFG